VYAGRVKPPLTRQDALRELARFGIRGTTVYLIDVLPIIEMMWADGRLQDGERALLEKFLRQHVDNINALAKMKVLGYEEGLAFAGRFLRDRPDPELMQVLRAMIPPVRLSSSDVWGARATRDRILFWCLDIGAACVTDYPYGDHDRFSADEKACFAEIVQTLCGTPAAGAK